MNDKKREALEIAIGQIDKQFGKGAIMRLGEDQGAVQIEAIPTGSLALDMALGVGGIPRGRVVEIYGAESSGQVHPGLPHHGRGAENGTAPRRT